MAFGASYDAGAKGRRGEGAKLQKLSARIPQSRFSFCAEMSPSISILNERMAS